jgi:hypothetical protein
MNSSEEKMTPFSSHNADTVEGIKLIVLLEKGGDNAI